MPSLGERPDGEDARGTPDDGTLPNSVTVHPSYPRTQRESDGSSRADRNDPHGAGRRRVLCAEAS